MKALTRDIPEARTSLQRKIEPLSHGEYLSRRYIASLDGLRAIAVAFVITCHLHEKMWDFLHGQFGVTIFFVLSGYLITVLMLREEMKTGRVNLLSFYIRRTCRIFPLYYFVLGIYLLLILELRLWPDKVLPFRHSLPYLLTYFQEIPFWRNPQAVPPFYQSWSLGIEEKFYICFPILMIAVARSRLKARLILFTVCALACMVYEMLKPQAVTYHMKDYGSIMLGVLVALLLSQARLYQPFAGKIKSLALPALGLALFTQFYLAPVKQLQYAEMLYALAVAVLLGCLVSSQGPTNRALSWPPLVSVGKLSYGIYLVHILCIGLVEHLAKPGHGHGVGVLAYMGTFAVATGIAYLLNRTIEAPMIRFGRTLGERVSPKTHSRDLLCYTPKAHPAAEEVTPDQHSAAAELARSS